MKNLNICSGCTIASLITKILLVLPFVAVALPGGSASVATSPDYPFRDTSLPIEERLDDLLSRMTTDEKIATLISGFDYTGCPRLGIPDTRCADGPLGIASWGLRGRATAFPATLALAASWDIDLAREAGEAFAREWRSRGLDVFYGPGVNLSRASKSSRNFEYLGEDPYLAAEMAIPFTRALQGGGVMAVVKHFAGNEQEFDRYLVDTRADERTLRELYLRPFEEVIRRADAKGVMMAYNLLNGDYCAQNPWLINILRDEWGFRGTVMSDWGATHACKESILAGLDMELGTRDFLTPDSINPLLESGEIAIGHIDRMVRNIYRPLMELGIFERIAQPDSTLSIYSPRNIDIAHRMAAGGIVLLRNRGNLLPLGRKIRKIAVIGPNAAPALINDATEGVNHVVYGGGGSSKVHPWNLTSDLQAIINEFPDAEVTYCEGISNAYAERLFGRAGVVNFITSTDYFNPQVPDTISSWTTTIIPDRNDTINLFVRAQGGWTIARDGQMIADRSSAPSFSNAVVPVEAVKGEPINLTITYHPNRSNPREMRFGWDYASLLDFSAPVALAREADVVIFSGGFDSALEFEGTDRDFNLPYGQEQLIRALAEANPNLVVLLRGGGGMSTESWESPVPAILYLSYPGQEGGRAMAEILSGKVNPSAKLPFSWERRWEDSPAFGNYDENRDKRTIHYAEGLMAGYRAFDADTTRTPLFPFGHGLSYSTFDYSDISVKEAPQRGKQQFDVTFTVTNTSAIAGAEVPQLYITDLKSSEPRPLRELRGFTKLTLQPGESRTVTLPIGPDDLKFFSSCKGRWIVEPGDFRAYVGPSSALLPLSAPFKVK